jgi:citrate lyase subunit beta/citryl-CoA lyase
MLSKAGARGADALIIDLEDAVAPVAKAAARAALSTWLDGLAQPSFEVWVRVNHTLEMLETDLRAAVHPQVTGVMLPKVRTVGERDHAADLLGRFEELSGLRTGSILLLPIIETAEGMLAVAELARGRRVHQLMIGELDLGAELGLDPADPTAFQPLRIQVVVASAAGGIAPPLAPVSPDFRDLDGLREETQRLRRWGFGSRPAIHPAQVPVYNEVFTPSGPEVERAARMVELYDAALARGRGAVTDEDGHMVDEAVVRVARRVLDAARRAGVVL